MPDEFLAVVEASVKDGPRPRPGLELNSESNWFAFAGVESPKSKESNFIDPCEEKFCASAKDRLAPGRLIGVGRSKLPLCSVKCELAECDELCG